MVSQDKYIRSILIVDDDEDDYELVNEAIKEIDPSISLVYANNCERLLTHRKDRFDLILLDINMPQHDGFYILRSIRSHGHHDLPVVMYTNSMSPGHISKAYKEGANLFFSKPETFSGLIKALRKLVNLNWSSPWSVTKDYCRGGHYTTFQYDLP